MQETHGKPVEKSMIGPPVSVSKKAFAEMIQLTPGRISQLVKKGLPVESDGKIDIAKGRVWIAENVNPVRSAGQREDRLPFSEERQQTSLTAQRQRLAKEQADAAALKNAKARGEVVRASDVEREWGGILRKVRSGVMAVPSRLRQQLPHLTAHDVQLIDAELRIALEGLSHDE